MRTGFGQQPVAFTVTAPSGRVIEFTPEEEMQMVKDAARERVRYRMLRKIELERAAITAIGNAVGFAVGGFLVGWILGGKK